MAIVEEKKTCLFLKKKNIDEILKKEKNKQSAW